MLPPLKRLDKFYVDVTKLILELIVFFLTIVYRLSNRFALLLQRHSISLILSENIPVLPGFGVREYTILLCRRNQTCAHPSPRLGYV